MPTIEAHLKTQPIQDPHRRAMLNIMFTGYWLQDKVNQALKPLGITEPQYNVLRILKGSNGVPMNQYAIQERMIQRMSNVSRLVDKLVEKNLVERTICKDNRRRVDIIITKTGLQLLQDAEPVLKAGLEQMYREMNANDAQKLAGMLDDFRGK